MSTPPACDERPTVCFVICPSPAWWLLRGAHTRSHPELGRQIPQRQWYYDLSHGRVGRCQACQGQILPSSRTLPTKTPRSQKERGVLAFTAAALQPDVVTGEQGHNSAQRFRNAGATADRGRRADATAQRRCRSPLRYPRGAARSLPFLPVSSFTIFLRDRLASICLHAGGYCRNPRSQVPFRPNRL